MSIKVDVMFQYELLIVQHNKEKFYIRHLNFFLTIDLSIMFCVGTYLDLHNLKCILHIFYIGIEYDQIINIRQHLKIGYSP